MTAPRILIVRFSSLGDVILTTPLLSAIAERHPKATVTFVTRDTYAPLLDTNPCVTEVIGWPRREPIPALAGLLRERKFDVGLDLQRSLRSWRLRRAVRARWFAYPKGRLARWSRVWLGYNPRNARSVVDRYFAAARALGVSRDGRAPAVYPTDQDRKAAAELAPEGCVVLAPGASRPSKRWPAAYWRALADRLLDRGHTVVAVGSAGERTLLSGGGIVEAYGLPLRTAAAVLERARVVVCNDSGALHLAAAVKRPVVALFGPTAAAEFLPPNAAVLVLERFPPCRPCSSFGSSHCPLGHHRCMIEISPEEVDAALEVFG
ncbi:ADP-heptose--LPS heptosyltransferase 2 [bacterium HR33]|nr:ADP-heptose--LPS heptosyltransferase 2 [bacterium HR33]